MAPVDTDILQWQTNEIIQCLLNDDYAESRCMLDASLETDSVSAASHDDFDPVLIADKLRSVADSMNENAEFKAALTDLKKAVAQEAIDAAFSQSMEAICQTHVAQRAEVAPEMQLIRATVAFGLYVKNASPELKNKIQGAMNSFLNRRVGPWLSQQGGWEKVISD